MLEREMSDSPQYFSVSIVIGVVFCTLYIDIPYINVLKPSYEATLRRLHLIRPKHNKNYYLVNIFTKFHLSLSKIRYFIMVFAEMSF